MAEGKISLEFSSDAQKLLASMAAQEAKIQGLESKLATLRAGYESAGKSGEETAKRVAKAVGETGDAKEREVRALKDSSEGWKKEAESRADAAEEGEAAFGTEAVEQLKTYVGHVVSLGTAFKVAAGALKALNEERNAGAAGVEAQLPARAALAQVAGGDPAELKRMIGASEATRSKTGMSADSAMRMQFTLESLGLAEHRELFAGFSDIMGDPAKFAESAGTIRTAFGEGEAGSVREVVNKLLKAGTMSKVSTDQFAAAMAGPANLAGQIGASDEEVLAAGAILTRATKSAEIGGTQLKALQQSILTRGLGGQGLLGGVQGFEGLINEIMATQGLSADEASERERNQQIIANPMLGLEDGERQAFQRRAATADKLRARQASGGRLSDSQLSTLSEHERAVKRIEAQRQAAIRKEAGFAELEAERGNVGKRVTELFGSVEAVSAFESIRKNWGDIIGAHGEIDLAGRATGRDDLAARTQALMMSDPELRAAREKKISEQLLLQQQERQFGVDQLKIQTTGLDLAQQDLARGVPDITRLLNKAVGSGLEYLAPIMGSDGEMAADASMIRGTKRLDFIGENIAKGLSHVYGMAGAAEVGGGAPEGRMAAAAEKMANAAEKLANAAEKGRPPALSRPDVDR